MRLWFSRSSEISLRNQLVTQVVLSILSGDLAPGQRLPSTRELALRFRLHPNTVSSGYRQLEREKWVEFRKGSGIYVRGQKAGSSTPEMALDQLIADFLRTARRLDMPMGVVRSRLRQWLEMQPPDHFLVIEPDEELARIMVAEMQKALTFPVRNCKPDECKSEAVFEGAIAAALSMTAKTLRNLLPANGELLTLHLRSVGSSLAPYVSAPRDALIGIASRWPPFLKTARTMLIAAGFHSDGLVVRDAAKPNWRRGLKQTSAVVCDTLTAQGLDGTCRVLRFPLLAESSLKELHDYEQLVRQPLGS